AGMQRYIKELKPSNLGDIAAMIALYRPGPMEHIDTFIDAKHGRTPITYPHPSLKELLDETYGVIVYQDQVLLILQRFAGYTLGEADTVRKAMGKKIASLMAEERDRFIDGALGKGFDRPLATQVFDLIEPFAGYAFNKAHSVSYALISYWTAYFKAHYPLEYMCSVLNSRLDNTDRIVSSINECSKLQIPVLLPDINRSGEFFTIDKESGPVPSLRFGLAAVKTVGEGAVRPLVAQRQENGPFDSIDDFCRRADMSGLNRRTLESLVRAGAFDTLGSRGAVASALDQIVATAQLETRTRNSGQTSLFGGMDQANAPQMTGISLNALDVSNEEKAAWEKELLGVSLSYNPLMALAGADVGDGINSIDQLDEDMQGLTYTLVGHAASVTERYTREQKKFLVINFDLLGGQVEVLVWPDVLERTAEMWAAGRLLRTTGKLRLRGDGYSLACEQVSDFVPQASSAVEMGEASVPAIRETPTPAKPGNGQSGNGGGGPAADTPRRNGGNGATRHQANGSYRTGPNGNGNGNGRGGSNGPGSGAGATATASMTNARTVYLGISESDDPIEDAHLLREVISMLLEYPGKDRVNLEIYTEGRRVVMDLPVVSTGYCDEMRQRLESLLGANSVLLQGSDGPDVDDVPF
ncbi:MAG: DNA polymerase III subunit alpha, partial [Chloroflexota bacterium]|nr:DNA polymerase III subunit alpha [Chloroflexota bacterium]